ncbi:MAG: hypothetical protein QOK03_2435, partial [Candidatus Binataceae bacterium]|nr:hypothetical protein [Candidatus Binataceae bacterium]
MSLRKKAIIARSSATRFDQSGSLGPPELLLAQLETPQLARCGARQFVAKLDPAWIFVRRHSSLD